MCGLAALFVCLLAYGGATPGPRVAVHLLIAGGLGFVLSASPHVLQASGAAVRVAAAGALALLAVSTGFLPLPSVLGRILSPAWSTERAEAVVALSSLSPMDTLDAATMVVGAVSTAILAGCLPFRRRVLSRALRAHTVLAMATVAMVAAAAPPLYATFHFAPFVDSNHFGTSLLFGAPLIADAVLDPDRAPWERVAWALVLGAAAFVLSQSHVLMPILLGGFGCVVVFAMRWRPAWTLVLLGVPTTAVALLVAGMREVSATAGSPSGSVEPSCGQSTGRWGVEPERSRPRSSPTARTESSTRGTTRTTSSYKRCRRPDWSGSSCSPRPSPSSPPRLAIPGRDCPATVC